MREEIVILGGGAIGRGFLPWMFREHYDFVFVDTNANLVQRMRDSKSFLTHRIEEGEMKTLEVPVKGAYLPNEFAAENHQNVAAVFINVGPRNVRDAARVIEGLNCPIIVCENDPNKVSFLKKHISCDDVVFAVPDVITSNTAPKELLDRDPLSVMTESGELFIEATQNQRLQGEFTWCDSAELHKQWTAKLFLHNTPHCIAAYLGSLVGVTYVHEAMEIEPIRKIVDGAMEEMLNAVKCEYDFPEDFLDWYAKKELSRFSDPLLFDPISRVAREPLRKLERNGRLIGAAQLCLAHGLVPENMLVGIASAILFDDPQDPDSHISFMRRAMPHSSFLSYILQLGEEGPLTRVLSTRLESIISTLKRLQSKHRNVPVEKVSSPLKVDRWEREAELAVASVTEASLIIESAGDYSVREKESARSLVTDVDQDIERKVASCLKSSGYRLIGEESFDVEAEFSLSDEPCWIVDPLDGTTNFVSGLPTFCSSVGLFKGDSPEVGAISLPMFKELFFTFGERTYLNGHLQKVGESSLRNSLVAATFANNHQEGGGVPPEFQLLGEVDRRSRGCLRTGSAAANLAYVVAGRLQAVYGIGSPIWDIAGGLALARKAGCRIYYSRDESSHRVSYVVGTEDAASELSRMVLDSGLVNAFPLKF